MKEDSMAQKSYNNLSKPTQINRKGPSYVILKAKLRGK